ncbi:plasminogen receptor (KT) isoform X1 [Gadus chalcogrammus]|uniref:plasminogen receptor (KT) isoform X1 n=1 Tax=Gadus chalcogrammus TaxID=1042646 RepID=UPI0024C234F9|nr:plasminogen receptor (KT) isoform X1 [Gadus chalcogrammus]
MGQWNSTPSEIDEDEPFLLYKEQLQQERMMELQNQWLERTNAMEIAWSREFVRYYGAFCAVSTVGLCVGAFQRRRLVLLAPLVPLGCVLTYQLDQVYGTLRGRVREEAERLMGSERAKLGPPGGHLTFQALEDIRKARPNALRAWPIPHDHPLFRKNLPTPPLDAKDPDVSCGHFTK